MSAPLDGPPYTSEVVDTDRILTGPWTRWLQLFWSRVMNAVQSVGPSLAANLTNKSAAIATTTLYTVTQAGPYLVSYYLRVTTADAVSSSATVTLGWREGSQTCSKTFTAITGNTVTTTDSQVWKVYADSGTAITYAVAYASNTPATMRYRVSFGVEQL